MAGTDPPPPQILRAAPIPAWNWHLRPAQGPRIPRRGGGASRYTRADDERALQPGRQGQGGAPFPRKPARGSQENPITGTTGVLKANPQETSGQR